MRNQNAKSNALAAGHQEDLIHRTDEAIASAKGLRALVDSDRARSLADDWIARLQQLRNEYEQVYFFPSAATRLDVGADD